MTLPTELASSRLSVAPMMEWTDRHYRVLARMMSLHTKLYTEMVTAGDLAKKDAEGHKLLLDCSPEELEGGGVALQLGGNDPDQLREATATALAHPHARWAEINLNCGCPSDRVAGGANGCAGGGTFGAALMHTPDEVRACVSAMSRAACGVPVTVKCRLGTDKLNGYENLKRFVGTVATGGVQHFIIHSRECVLGGLTPKQNRSIPPLRPAWVHRLQRDFPDLSFAINGGIKSLEMAKRHLAPIAAVREGDCHRPGDICESWSSGKCGGSEIRYGGGGYDGYGSYGKLAEVEWNASAAAEDYEWHSMPAIGGVMVGREAYQRVRPCLCDM